MGRSNVIPVRQRSNEPACGPAALKHALAVLGKRKPLATLKEVCTVTRNGTSTKSMIAAVNKLGLSALVVKSSTLHHLHSALRYGPNNIRAVLVSYLYDIDENDRPHPDSGHWATVSGYLSSKSRIVLFDSYTGQKKSYPWEQFRSRWIDYDLKRRRVGPPAGRAGKRGRRFKIVRHWQPQLMMVVAKNASDLPRFSIATAKLFPANQTN